MDRKLAEEIVALVNGCIDQLISSLAPVEEHASPEDFAVYKRGVAKSITTLDTEIIQRIAHEYPDLLPADEDADLPDDEDEADIPKSQRN